MPTNEVWVYFVECETTRRIKIGSAINPPARLKGLQCGSPTKLRILTAEPYSLTGELELHRMFGKARLHGEWFRRIHPLVKHIEMNLEHYGPTPWVPKPKHRRRDVVTVSGKSLDLEMYEHHMERVAAGELPAPEYPCPPAGI